MKKFLSCLVLATLTALPTHAEYVRKTVRPGFFIPTKELEKVEKLPPFPERPIVENIEEDIDYEVETLDGQASMEFVDGAIDESQRLDLNKMTDKKIKVNLLQVHPMNAEDETDIAKALPSKPNQSHDDGLEKNKIYQKLHQQYQDDLKIIAKTGKAPENEELKTDLKKMDSNDSIWVDESFGKK